MTSGPVILRILLELNLEHFWPLRLFARLHIFRNRFRPILMSTACHGASLRKDWMLKSERIRKRILLFFTWCVKEKPEKNPLPEWILRFLRRKMIWNICLAKKRKIYFWIFSHSRIQSLLPTQKRVAALRPIRVATNIPWRQSSRKRKSFVPGGPEWTSELTV